MFLQVNEQEDFLHITSQPSNMGNQPVKLEFIVNIPPHKLTGIDVIWKILQECDKKNMDLTTMVVDLLTRLYHNLSSALTDQEILQIHDQFCR